jgi:hypothetical protein
MCAVKSSPNRNRCPRSVAGVLIVFVSSGCGSCAAPPPEPQIDPEVRAAVTDYWNAFMQREWDGKPNAIPNWRKGYELLHPQAKAQTTLAQFNQEKWNWVKDKPGFICELRFADAQWTGDSADVTLTISFGHTPRPESTCSVVTRLKKDGARWAVISTDEVASGTTR